MLRNFLFVGAGNYGALAVSLGVNALLTRQLGVDQFGHLALLLTASQVVALVAVIWTHTAAVRFGAQEYAASHTVASTFWTRIWLVTPWLATMGALLAGAAQFFSAYLMIPRWGLLLVFA